MRRRAWPVGVPSIMPPMLRMGKLTLDAPFFQAGLAGYSDTAMRLVARRHGAPFAVTEAMLDVFLNHGGRGLRAAELHRDDHPIAGQLMGSEPVGMARAARVLLRLGYDVIDVNLACPVKKIRRRSRGGHLLADADQAVAILDAVRQAVGNDAPCTVKLRRGSDDSPDALARFHRIFSAAMGLGYAGAVVHGRTVEQKYAGPARWEFLGALTSEYADRCQSAAYPQVSPPQPSAQGRGGQGLSGFVIGGSGDIWCAADIFEMLRRTGVAWVSVARGCIGNPWIFRQARVLMAGDLDAASRPPSIAQQRDVLLEHFELSMRCHDERIAALQMRKFGIKFARHHPQGADVARAFVAVRDLAQWRGVLDRFYQHNRPGASASMQRPSPLTDPGAAQAAA